MNTEWLKQIRNEYARENGNQCNGVRWIEQALTDIATLEAQNHELLEALRQLADCAGLTCLPGYRSELDAAMIRARAALQAE